jgi:cytochrome c-type biogenesis protein CcmH
MRWLRLIVFAALLMAPAAAFAVNPDEMLKDPALEARARQLSEQLRCMVCQNQSIDDSNAPLAHDLRVLVRQRLTAGDTNQQVLNYLVARYGDFILLKPPFDWETLLLWGTTPIALIIGSIGLLVMARRRKSVNTAASELSAEEQRRLATLVHPGAD